MLRAIFFDLDGLLVDTEPLYYEAHRSVFAEHGVVITREAYARRWIIRGAATAEEVPAFGITADPQAFNQEVRRRFRVLVAEHLALMPYARETLAAAAARWSTVLVTNSKGPEVESVLDRLGIRPFLHHLATRETYERAKPFPDAYAAALRLAGVGAREALALEDSPRGVKAAIAAGVPVIAVVNEWTRLEPPVGALRVLDSLAQLDLAGLSAAWTG